MGRPIATLSAAMIFPLALCSPPLRADDQGRLASYFGFDDKRIVVIDRGAGPVAVGDFNGNGRPDLAVVNNRKNRIELHLLRSSPMDDQDRASVSRVNEIPPSPWYDREFIGLTGRVTAIGAFDPGDGDPHHLFYASRDPSEIIRVQRNEQGEHETAARRRVPDLVAGADTFLVDDITGNGRAEVLTIAAGRIRLFPVDEDGRLRSPVSLGSADGVQALRLGDFDGDGRTDILVRSSGSDSPLRLWLQAGGERGEDVRFPNEQRFDTPTLSDALAVPLPGRDAHAIGMLERASRRVVLADLRIEDAEHAEETGAERQVRVEVIPLAGSTGGGRSVIMADLDGDGLPDLLATDPRGNAVAWHRQREGEGLDAGTLFSSLKRPAAIAGGRWDDTDRLSLFTLSEEENAVGVSTYNRETGRLSFPEPIRLATTGGTPVTMKPFEIGDVPSLAVVMRDRRQFVLELHNAPGSEGERGGEGRAIELPRITRPPRSILAAGLESPDAPDLLLLMPNEPMLMVRGLAEDEPEVLQRDDMPHFGLVQAAGPDNTALLDINGDGREELLIADENFVRACAFDPERGWRVVEQVTIPETGTNLGGLALYEHDGRTTVVVADAGHGRLLSLRPDEDGVWDVRETVAVSGASLGAILAGPVGGDGRPAVLSIADDSVGLIRLAGQRVELDTFASHRAEAEDRQEHRLAVGDVNDDGFVDIVTLDSEEHFCQILTLSASRRLMHATEFKVFESMLYTFGGRSGAEPRHAIVTDLTGDGRDDILVLVHDRLLIYPQASKD